MRLSIDARLHYSIEQPADLLVQIETAAMSDQTIVSERFDAGTSSHIHRILAEDNVGTRVWLRCEEELRCHYHAEVEVSRSLPDLSALRQDPVHTLPHEAVRYLMASRYCPSDEFQSFVAAEFNRLDGGATIQEMANWIADHFTYSPGASGPQTTALDTFVQRRGICRDFAHVLVSLARARAIPARMVSAYGPEVNPPDFHAVVQVWLEGRWHLVDPTRMCAPDRLAIIGVGRDAADIAFLTSYGWVTLVNQTVQVREIA